MPVLAAGIGIRSLPGTGPRREQAQPALAHSLRSWKRPDCIQIPHHYLSPSPHGEAESRKVA